MPTNLYGPGDNYHLENGHVLAALIMKFCEAKINNFKEVTCWGTGEVFREFLHVDDLAEACFHVLENWYPDRLNAPKLSNGNILTHLNVGTGKEISIKELAFKIAKIINFDGKINWDTSKPDGTPRKKLDISRIEKMGWGPKISLETGLINSLEEYKKLKK